MKFSIPKKILFLAVSLGTSLFCRAQSAAWTDVPLPEITGISVKQDDLKTVLVQFTMETSKTGADKGEAVMTSSSGSNTVKTIGKTRRSEKKVEFEMKDSGTYTFTVSAMRNGENKKHTSHSVSFTYTYPLENPVISLLNLGDGSVSVKWNAVHEAESYEISYTAADGKTQTVPAGNKTEYVLTGLKAGNYSDISVAAVRKNEKAASAAQHKLVRSEKEREWNFAWFGQSAAADRNKIEILDSNNLKFTLKSCTFNQADGAIIDKGGKFTNYHDGISFYYTVINPQTENFELTATVHVDYINPTADGQEGFGLLAMDSLGQNGVNSVNHYTNSAGLLSWKYTTHVNGAKKEIKDGLGARFVSNITSDVLAMGDSGIAENGVVAANAFNYDNANTVRTGDTFRITLKKTNTGYHAIYIPADLAEGIPTEYIMYGPEKLCQLDKNHIYVGFAVARGTNATFSDIDFKVSDPKKDPPAQEEPPELIPLTTVVDCPSSYYTRDYPFVYRANANGSITVATAAGEKLISDASVKADADFTKTIKLPKSINDLIITFKPEDGFKPQPKQVIAQYNSILGKYEQNYKAVTSYATVIIRTYKGSTIYASPNGSIFGKGTAEKPVDLLSAISYVSPGQTIVLSEGTYHIDNSKGLIIERGNSGTSNAYKTLTVQDKKRAVLDFSASKGGMQIWGDYWTIKNIDVTKTADNIKGIQVAGNYNVLDQVNAYYNGDTGIQISGQGFETFEKWPHDNLILNCTSYGNCDSAQNNADGFAAKLTCGNGNVFRGCISYGNIDDGWDLFAKIESGPIGTVLIENCLAYKNGSLPDGSGKGDGNGFKLGGDGIAVAHILRNSISYSNGMSGITSNSNPALILENVTSFGNGSSNIALYGKGSGSPRLFKATGVLSIEGTSSDNIREMPELLTDSTYFCNGSNGVNKSGSTLKAEDAFVSTDAKSIIPGRKADGSIDMKTLLELTSKVPSNIGANLK